MTYQITSRQLANARRIGVKIKPSTVKGKKLDVFKGEKKVASIGAASMMDFDRWKAKEGIEKAKEWMPFQEYIDFMRNKGFGRFYTVDQNYFHLMVFANANIDFREMNNGWNSQIHYIRGPLAITNNINDERNENTKFVHVQMTGHTWNEQSLYEIVNLPQSKWRFKYEV